jgi:hypothetical protein
MAVTRMRGEGGRHLHTCMRREQVPQELKRKQAMIPTRSKMSKETQSVSKET